MMQKLVVAGLVSLALVGCNSGSGSSDSETAKFNLAFSDAPVDGLKKVCVAFNQISVHHTDGSESSWGMSSFAVDESSLECTPNHKLEDIPGYEEGKPKFMVIDLMAYQGSDSLQVLSDEELAAGKYTEIHLNAVSSGDYGDHESKPTPYSHVVTSLGSVEKLGYTNANGKIIIPNSFEVSASATQGYTLEFDLRKSIVGDSSHPKGYRLKTTGIRLVDNTSVATIDGIVSSEACSSDISDAYIYVYTAPTDGNYGDLGSESEPYASVAVKDDRTFEMGYVPLGNYDIALVCNGSEDAPASESVTEPAPDKLVIDSVFENETLEASGLTFTF